MPQLTCDTCAVRHRSVCGALSRDEITRVNAIARHKHIARGQVIMRVDDEPDYFANIVSGVVKLSRAEADGHQVVVGLQFASDFLGRPFRPRVAFDAQALTDVHLCTFPRRPFEALVAELPDLEHRLFERTLDELDAAREWMTVLGRRSAREKVATLLTMMASRMRTVGCKAPSEEEDAASFELPMARSEMADYLGLTIETVSRQFTQLKSDGLIALPSHRDIVILDQDALLMQTAGRA